ncbi:MULTISPECIES: hypothetical protein [Streptomyces]|uniref:hypothetical protein n=1 Tax=Streptomyces TaxID=1883 RepID=UPI002250EE81|nr:MULTISPECIES: hypothetical protein [Streptomyces]MCX5277712.1 hypothetical protein [Streptomyces virginiae]MCX5583059.1 hypothetical protein [Streptomyces erythrochromogenes]
MERQRRTAAWCGRLLLSAALLVGLVTMHVLGHPAEHASSRTPDRLATVAFTVVTVDGEHRTTADAAPAKGGHTPLPGLDTALVCLALLTACTVVFRVSPSSRYRLSGLLLAGLARLLRALWPMPPPVSRSTFLARLSLLRI